MSTIQNFDFDVNVLQAIPWAYSQAENLQALIQSKQDFYDENHTAFWQDWVANVFDIRTANEFGLSVWAIILDFPLFGEATASPSNYPNFGFAPFGQNFNNGNFATDTDGVLSIPIEQKRLLLRLRAYNITHRVVTPDVNAFLLKLFGPDQIYMVDNLDMSVTYSLVGEVAAGLEIWFNEFDILPRPSGVSINIVNLTV